MILRFLHFFKADAGGGGGAVADAKPAGEVVDPGKAAPAGAETKVEAAPVAIAPKTFEEATALLKERDAELAQLKEPKPKEFRVDEAVGAIRKEAKPGRDATESEVALANKEMRDLEKQGESFVAEYATSERGMTREQVTNSFRDVSDFLEGKLDVNKQVSLLQDVIRGRTEERVVKAIAEERYQAGYGAAMATLKGPVPPAGALPKAGLVGAEPGKEIADPSLKQMYGNLEKLAGG